MRRIVCFHNPEEVNGYLSNWFLSDFMKAGIAFSSMEQYMMYRKAELFHDLETASQILMTSNVGKIKALGRSVQHYDDLIWSGMRQVLVYEGLLEKFRQNDILRDKLLGTQQDILAECAVQDRIWGIGLSMRDEKRFEIEAWRGQNLLGFTLMLVRDKLVRDQTIQLA
ncbi:MAG: NADAR family protein [Oscillospiraceae bacterium]|nr:NADAR family protein [Oscillospiraceae bacterium]